MQTEAVVLLILLTMLILSCSEEPSLPKKTPATSKISTEGPSWQKLKRRHINALKQAQTEVEKWNTLSELEGPEGYIGTPEQRFTRHDVIRGHIATCSPLSCTWLDLYPEIAYRIEWDTELLLKVASHLGSSFQPKWDEGIGGVRTYRRMTRPQGKVASIWLYLVTHRRFEDQREVEDWLERVNGRLNWDKESRRFVVSPE